MRPSGPRPRPNSYRQPGGSGPSISYDRVGVIVPAHDEEELVGGCLDALAAAAGHPDLAAVRVHVLVILDDCADGTAETCAAHGVATMAIRERNVGRARAAGFATLLADTGGLWLATTDADTRVAPDWLAEQLRLARRGADATFGVVDVDDWHGTSPMTPARFAAHYAGTAPGVTLPHQHVHGASLGLSADAYRQVGGMPALAVGEDRALSARLRAEPGLRVARTTAVRVNTSGRLTSRVRGGFADVLRTLAGADGPGDRAGPAGGKR